MATFTGRNIKPEPINIDYESRFAWERLEHEGTKPYQAFCIYRDMGLGRTVLEAYRIYIDRPDKPYVNIYFLAWARRFRWVERAQAYDDYLEARQRRIREDEIEKTAERHVRQIRNFAALLNNFEHVLMRKLQENPDLKGVKLTDLMNTSVRGAAILPRLHEAEMTALGKPTKVEVTGENGGPILVRYMPPTIVEGSDVTPDAAHDEEHTGEEDVQ